MRVQQKGCGSVLSGAPSDLDLSDSRLEIIVRMQVVGAIAILRILLADAECLIAR